MTKAEIITQRVEALRAWMREHKLDAYIFPSTDPHAGEYVPEHWKTREWISGFTGSAGTAVVTMKHAALWTDSRYWLAAEEQMEGTPFEVVRCGRNVATAEELIDWIFTKYNRVVDIRVGLDAWTNTATSVKEMNKVIDEQFCQALDLVTDLSPADELWTQRPPLPTSPIVLQPLELAGRTTADKLSDIRRELMQTGADSLLVTQLDEIAWVLNLRGSDVHCTPVFVSYLLILADNEDKPGPQAILYVNEDKLDDTVRDYLMDNGIQLCPYEAIQADLLNGDAAGTDLQLCAIQYDPDVTCHALSTAVERGNTLCAVQKPSPIPALRAIKNPVEIEGFREAMLRDGVAMVKFLRTLSPLPREGENTAPLNITEMGVDEFLTSLRAEQPGFRGLSFDTIAGYGAHGAIVHYEATPETDVPLEPRGLLLLDSGAQYDCGTTDITRTIPLGPLTDEERRDYTLVLKGHIRLATAVFPEGTSGTQLDVLARYAMWQDHKNYGHGTGHGVGSYLSVHEGPHQFRMNYVPAQLQAGMTVTIEPGIYIAGSHGVRIENTMLIVPDPPLTPNSAPASPSLTGGMPAGQSGSSWLRLEPLTLCPIDTRPIIREMLLPDEIDYLNRYHARVREALLPRINDPADRDWLIAATQPFS